MRGIKKVIQVATMGLVWVSSALAGYDIESAGSTNATILSRFVNFLQDFVDLLDGPVAIAVVIGGVIVALCLWVFAPDNRHLNKAFKAVAAGFIALDIGLLINYMRA